MAIRTDYTKITKHDTIILKQSPPPTSPKGRRTISLRSNSITFLLYFFLFKIHFYSIQNSRIFNQTLSCSQKRENTAFPDISR